MHGMTKTRLYNIWKGMKQRCYNTNAPKFHNHGGRGIKICFEWLDEFMTFYGWAMENGYEDDLTIDRIDNNGDYTPENCRWATLQEQNENLRKNVFLTYEGDTMTISEACRRSGIGKMHVYKVYNRAGCSLQQAFNYLLIRRLLGIKSEDRTIKFEDFYDDADT
jgi:hypothetical protein